MKPRAGLILALALGLLAAPLAVEAQPGVASTVRSHVEGTQWRS